MLVESRRNGRRAVEVSVADTGPGVADEVAEADRIFEPFVTSKQMGLGMGLAISHSIVETHGGGLRMARKGRSGAVFIFDLPMAEAAAGPDVG
jgi:two-component system, LuxR family, sensor kinase FixL